MQAIPEPNISLIHPIDKSSTNGISKSYDFIIVGGGTAGLVVASRLSENPGVQVLVIEAGKDTSKDLNTLVPGLGFGVYDNPDYDWCFQSEGLLGRKIPHNRGKVLGGSSGIYQHQLVFNPEYAFDAWETLGNSGWNGRNMLPYQRKFHTHQEPGDDDLVAEIKTISKQDAGIPSTEGPIKTTYSQATPIDKDWYESWETIISGMGYDGKDVGGFLQPNGIDPKTRTRSYAATAYYSADISSRPNLRVVTEALVENILVEKSPDLTATGVTFVSKSGTRHSVTAKKEVVLSAGVFNSPTILELSGIGSSSLLSKHGIPVLLDLTAVGENLQDHQAVMVSFEVNDGVQTGDIAGRNPEVMNDLLAMFEKDASGPLGHAFISHAHSRLPGTFGEAGPAFLPSLFHDTVPSADKTPSLEDKTRLDLLSRASVQQALSKVQFNVYPNEKIGDMTKPKTEGNFFSIFFALNHPFSRGSCHIASSDPKAAPEIDPKYMSHPMDLELMARHTLEIETLISTPPFSQHFKKGGKRIPGYAYPEGKKMDLDTAKRVVKEHMISHYHPAGTCALGKVVDERLRVKGVKGLRVVDASVFPLMPRGNIITTVYAVAERGADLIKEDWA